MLTFCLDNSSRRAQQQQPPQPHSIEYGPLPDDLANIALDSFDHLTSIHQQQQTLNPTHFANLNLQQQQQPSSAYQNVLFGGGAPQSFTFTLLPSQPLPQLLPLPPPQQQPLPLPQQIFNLVVPNSGGALLLGGGTTTTTNQSLQQSASTGVVSTTTAAATAQLCHNTPTTTAIMNLPGTAAAVALDPAAQKLKDLNDFVYKRYYNQAKSKGKSSVCNSSFYVWAREARAELDPLNRVAQFKPNAAWLENFLADKKIKLPKIDKNKAAATTITTTTGNLTNSSEQATNSSHSNAEAAVRTSTRKPRKRQKTSKEFLELVATAAAGAMAFTSNGNSAAAESQQQQSQPSLVPPPPPAKARSRARAKAKVS